MLNVSKEAAVHIVRKEWTTRTGNRSLSLGDFGGDVFEESFIKAHAPSVLRAVSYNGKYIEAQKARFEARNYGVQCFKSLYKDCKNSGLSKEVFDNRVYGSDGLLDTIYNIYQKFGISDYSYGNAQKLIHVASKYLLSSNQVDQDNSFFEFIGAPIDRIVIIAAQDEGLTLPTNNPWSRYNRKEVIDFEKKLFEIIKNKYGVAPLFWECCIWNKI